MESRTRPSATAGAEPAPIPAPDPVAPFGFGILGPLRVVHGGEPVEIPAGRQQALLAALLLRAGETVPAATLMEQVWGGAADRTVLNVCVMRLRRTLRDRDHALIRAEGGGYRIAVPATAVDLHRFRRLCALAGEAAEPERERALLREALALWRGEALTGIASPVLQTETAPILEEERLAAVEQRVEADLACGTHTEVIGELRRLVAEHPFRERFWCQLLLALYRCGRQSEALAGYRLARDRLARELGIEPGAELRGLHHRILGSDPDLLEPRPIPGPAARAVPAQLPPATAGFHGRAEQLRRLDRLLTGPAPATLVTGPPGVGKTALAVHWAGRNRPHWPDGQLYLDLRGYGPGPAVRADEALAYLLRALGVPADRVPGDPAEAAALFRSQIADRRMLLLLDNAAGSEQVRPLLPGGHDTTVLIVGRDRLGGLAVTEGARQLPLDVLPDAEARTLLAETVGTERFRAEPETLDALARLCGNLPLALRITAADLLDHPRRSLAEHLAGLRDGDRLDALRVAGDDGTAVRTAVRSSYVRLPEPARRLLRSLGLFPGPEFTAPAAAALAGTGAAETEALLDRLVSAHLLSPRGADRFALHDLLRLFAAEAGRAEDPEPERDAAVRRLYGHYAATGSAAMNRLFSDLKLLPPDPHAPEAPAFGTDAAAMAWLDGEHTNLVALVRLAARRADHLDACRLGVMMQSHLFAKLHTVDWLTVNRAAMASARAIDHRRTRYMMHLGFANLHRIQSQRRGAIKHFERALLLARGDGWIEGEAIVHNNLSGVYDQEGDLRSTAEHLRRALKLRESLDKSTAEAIVLGNLGRVLLRLGQVDDAVAHLERATAVHHRFGSRMSEARSIASLGEALAEQGRHDRALTLFAEATRRQRELDDRMYLPNTLARYAKALLVVGETDRAGDLAADALDLVETTDHRRSAPYVTLIVAAVDEQAGRHAAALERYRRADRLSLEVGNRYVHAQATIGLGTTHARLDEPGPARRHLDTALAVARRYEFRLLERQAAAARAGLA